MIDKFIPLDKSWIIRMGILDLLYGDVANSLKVLDENEPLSDDLVALRRILKTWNTDSKIEVGESGTLYRQLLFINWKFKLNKQFITSGTLSKRKITADPSIVELTQTELLKLDNNTSQWATAAVLCGDEERLNNPPFKLALTYEAWDHWHSVKPWQPRQDETIKNQADAFLRVQKGEPISFEPEQAEDYPFAYAFGLMDDKEGLRRWPSLGGHESNRIKDMPAMMELAKSGTEIPSKDHRIVQALAMWGNVNNKAVKFLYPESVSKSWPQFWVLINSN